MNSVQFKKLLSGLLSLSGEKEWIEFKENRADPEEIGEYISALANSARLKHEPFGYIIWGINDLTHEVVGTEFIPEQSKKGNEELEHWLMKLLQPQLHFRFETGQIDSKRLVILEIPATLHTPVKFKGTEFIRIGSLKKKLKDYPETERELWESLSFSQFEEGMAKSDLDSDEVLNLLDYSKYFEMTTQPLPQNKSGLLAKLQSDALICKIRGNWSITNLGAILFAKNLNNFERLFRKALRVIEYQGKNRIHTKREISESKGYAIAYEGFIQYLNNLLPANEEIGQAFREEVRIFPEIAIRELIANALIHQDFTISGAGPMVEIFEDRIEITNPGKPLIDTLRMLDEPPRSRNESLAALMRRMNICEERGTGIDKVIFEVELYQLPAPKFTIHGSSIVATLYSYQKLRDMNKESRIRACYQHACLQYVSNESMTNTSLRKRFNISSSNAAQASRIITQTLDAGYIRAGDPENQSRKHANYIPYWVEPDLQ